MSWAEKIFANTLFVADLDISRAFYSSIFEKSPVFEDDNSVIFKFGELLINLLSQSQAPSLIGPALVASKSSGSRFQLTIHVDDVDAQAQRLMRLGVTLINGPMDRPWGNRTILFSDPDGHLWELAQ
jgi:catechol 2,3-dioxygenase-like lactoylglutathione lyase family enzyme